MTCRMALRLTRDLLVGVQSGGVQTHRTIYGSGCGLAVRQRSRGCGTSTRVLPGAWLAATRRPAKFWQRQARGILDYLTPRRGTDFWTGIQYAPGCTGLGPRDSFVSNANL